MRRIIVLSSLLALVAWAVPALAQTIVGTGANETITGTQAADDIDAAGGHDNVHALEGSDLVSGGSGSDELHGNEGDDTLTDPSGVEAMFGDAGNDTLRGGGGNDALDGGLGHDELAGEAGTDTLIGGAGDDDATGDSGNETFDAGTGHDTFDGDSGTDSAHGGPGLDVLYADQGNDNLLGEADSDVLVVLSESGSPILDGGAGRDVIVGGRGSLRGSQGDDVIYGFGNASIDGGDGADVCHKTSGVTAVNCEQVVVLGSATATPSLTIQGGPAEHSTTASPNASFVFTATGTHKTWCVTSLGAVTDCSSGSLELNGLASGDHAVAIIAVANGAKAPALGLRRFTVATSNQQPEIDGAVSPSPDRLDVATRGLVGVATARARFEDGGSASWLLSDPRVAVDPPAGMGASVISIVDPNLGRERVTSIDLLDATGAVVATRSVNVWVDTSVVLSTAVSNGHSSLTIVGEHFSALDRVVLIHAGGSLSILLSDPGVVVGPTQIEISSSALDGLQISQIDAVIAVDGMEVVASMEVDITIASADTTAPTITAPAALQVEAASATGAIATFVTDAADAVDGQVDVNCAPPSGSEFPIGVTTVTCEAADAAGNEASVTFDVTVVDQIPPSLILPETISVNAAAPDGSDVEYSAHAVDLVDGLRDALCVPESGSRFPVGVTIVQCSAADTRGNIATGSFQVHVRDVTAPALEFIGSTEVVISSATGAPVNFTVTAVDDVDGALDATCMPPSGSIFTPGRHLVACEALDSAGNRGSLEFELVVTYRDPYEQVDSIIENQLPEIAATRFETYLPMSASVELRSEDRMIVDVDDGAGGIERVYAEGSFGIRGTDGVLRAIDTSLAAVSGGWTPRVVRYDMTLPNHYSEGIAWNHPTTGEPLHITPISTNGSAPAGSVSGTAPDRVTYPLVWANTHVVAIALEGGIKEHLIATSTDAPRQFTWNLDGPAGSSLDVTDEALELVLASGDRIALGSLPVASDAQDMLVPVWYEVDGLQLTMRWTPQVSPDGLTSEPATFPIDLDPQWFEPRVVTEFYDPPQDGVTSDDRGIGGTCRSNSFDINFVGFGEDASRRLFLGGDVFASAACGMGGPPPGGAWHALNGKFTWKMSGHQRVQLKDAESRSPRAAVENAWMGNFAISGVDNQQSGARTITWDASQAIGTPRGAVRWLMRQEGNERLGTGDSRSAELTMTRLFKDSAPPIALAFAPNIVGDPPLVKGGERNVSFSAVDAGAGCADGAGMLVVRDANGDIFDEVAFDDCVLNDVVDFDEPGAFDLMFYAGDAIGNGFALSDDPDAEINYEAFTPLAVSSLVIADPINLAYDQLDESDIIGAEQRFTLQVPQDHGPGTAQLWGTSAVTGARFPITAEFTANQLYPYWNTREIQNGGVQLELVLTPDSGGAPIVLETVNVSIENARTMQIAAPANAAATTLEVPGWSVLHANGALQGSFVDAQQPGANGVTLSVTRSFNSLDFGGGVFGPGWRANFEQRINSGPDQIPAWIDENGREWVYMPLAGGGFERPTGQVADLRINTHPTQSLVEPWIVTYPDGRERRFGPDGLIVRETWPAGQSVRYTRRTNGDGSIDVLVRDDRANTLVVHIGTDGRVDHVDDPLGRRTTYTYEQANAWAPKRLISAVDPSGVVTTHLGYAEGSGAVNGPSVNPVSAVATSGGGVLGLGLTSTTTDFEEPISTVTAVSAGTTAARTFDYEAEAGVVVTTGARVETTMVDELGQLDAVTNAAGATTEFTYNDRGQLEEIGVIAPNPLDPAAEPEYIVEQITDYSPAGHVIAEEDGEGNTTEYHQLDAFGNARLIINAEGEETTATFDAEGRKLTETDPLSATTRWTYAGENPQPISMDPPAGASVEYTYSETGQRESESWVDDGERRFITRATYDSAGQLLSTRQGELPPTTYDYDDAGRLLKTVDPVGNEQSTQYGFDGQPAMTIDGNGNETESHTDSFGRVYMTRDALDATTWTNFDTYGNVGSTTDARNHTTAMYYDNADNLVLERDALGRETRTVVDALGNAVREIDGEGNAISYTFDANSNELGSLHPGPYPTATGYTKLQNTSVETDERGFSTTYGYDLNGRETSVTNAENETTRTGYDEAGRIEWNEDARQLRTSYQLDELGRIERTALPGSAETSSTWDDAGRELTRTDERNKTTVLSYDDAGRILSELRPGGESVAYTYDDNGNRLTEQNASGDTTTFEYDELNRRRSIVLPNGQLADYSFDEVGNLVQSVSSVSGTTTYEYDEANQRISMTPPSGDQVTYEYDNRGLLRFERSPLKTTEYRYDARGNLNRVESGDAVSTYTHDGTGNVLVHTLADGSTITYTYDKVGRKTGEVHSSRGATTWTFDDAGNVLTETTSAGTTAFAYDERGRVESISYPGGLVSSFTYDGAGNLLTVADWAGVRSFTRNDAGRVEAFTTVQGKAGSRSYDTAGRLVSQTHVNLRNQVVMQSWDYNADGQLVEFDTGTGLISYAYDTSGRLESKTSDDGYIERFEYDGAGRLRKQTLEGERAVQYSYDGLGRVALIEVADLASGEVEPVPEHRYTYSSSGQLASWWYRDDQYRTAYTYDARGNLETIDRTLGGAPGGSNTPAQDAAIAACFAPDGLDGCNTNLRTAIIALGATLPADLDPRSYDPVSRPDHTRVARYLLEHSLRLRTFEHDSQGTVTGVTFFNASAATGSTRTFARDNRGNQVPDNTQQVLEYDYANRLTRSGSTPFPGRKAHFRYAHDGKLVDIVDEVSGGDSNPDVLYDYDPEGRVISVLSNPTGSFLSLDLAYDDAGFAAARLNSANSSQDVLYPTFNHRGDVDSYHFDKGAGWDPENQLRRFTPWGEVDQTNQSINTSASPLLPGWQGRHGTLKLYNAQDGSYRDDYWMGARTYNAVQGRFRQVDPLPGQDGITDTAYSYAANDPVNQFDPDGKACRATASLVFGPKSAWAVGSDGTQAAGAPNVDMKLALRCNTSLRRDAYFTLRYNFCRKDGDGRPINSSCAPGGDVTSNCHRYANPSNYKVGSGAFRYSVQFLCRTDGLFLANSIGVLQSCGMAYQQRFGMIAQWYTDDPDPGDPADGPYTRFTPKFKRDVPNAWGKVYPCP